MWQWVAIGGLSSMAAMLWWVTWKLGEKVAELEREVDDYVGVISPVSAPPCVRTVDQTLLKGVMWKLDRLEVRERVHKRLIDAAMARLDGDERDICRIGDRLTEHLGAHLAVGGWVDIGHVPTATKAGE